MATKEVRRKPTADGGAVVVERMALGQVADYSVYVESPDGEKTFVGSGGKREALRLYERTGKS